MGRPADPLRHRRIVAGIFAWVAFGVCWWLVLSRDSRTWGMELLIPPAALVVVTAVTVLWVRHNLAIFRRAGPRRGLPASEQPWRRDSLGRPIDLPVQAVTAPLVRLSLEDGVKRYRVIP